MAFLDTVKGFWPLLAMFLTLGAIPFAIRFGRRWDALQERRDLHEERRTKAAEEIPRALRDLRDQVTESVRAEALATRQALDATKGELLRAIQGEDIEQVKDLIRECVSSEPEILTPALMRRPRT